MPMLIRSPSGIMRAEKKPSLVASLAYVILSICFNCIIWYYVKSTLEEYSEPGTNVIKELKPLKSVHGACLEEYKWLDYWLSFIIAASLGQVLLTILARTAFHLAHTKPCGGVLLALVCAAEASNVIAVLGVVICGLRQTVFVYNRPDISTCERLHNDALWISTGFLLVGVASGVCSGCGLCLGAAASAREAQVAVEDEVNYEQLPNEAGTA